VDRKRRTISVLPEDTVYPRPTLPAQPSPQKMNMIQHPPPFPIKPNTTPSPKPYLLVLNVKPCHFLSVLLLSLRITSSTCLSNPNPIHHYSHSNNPHCGNKNNQNNRRLSLRSYHRIVLRLVHGRVIRVGRERRK